MTLFGSYMEDNSPKYMFFFNSTRMPVQISSWVTGSDTMHSATVRPFQRCLVHSSVGEWHLDSMLEHREMWTQTEGLKDHLVIGKFRSKACASGDYAWIYPPFEGIYSVLPSGLGLLTLFLETTSDDTPLLKRRRHLDHDVGTGTATPGPG